MPLDLRYRPPIRSAYAWLGAWGLWTLWSALDYRDLAAPSLAPIHFLFLGIGFAGNLLIGLAHHLAAHFSLRKPPPGWVLATESGLVSAAALGALAGHEFPAMTLLATGASAAWASGLALFGAMLLRQALAKPTEAANPYRAGLPGDRTSDLLIIAVAAYALLAAPVVVAVGMTAAPAVHFWLVGVVATAIFMVVHRVVPRFSRRWMPKWFHVVQGVMGALGPLLLAAGMWRSDRLALWGGAIEYVAISLYTTILGYGWVRRKNRHPALALPALAAGFLFLGANLGIWFLHDAARQVHLGIHVVNNLWGFLVLTALGMASAMLGLGVVTAHEHPNRHVWRVGVAAVTALVAWDAASWSDSPSAGIFAFALGVLALVQATWGLKLRFAGKPIVPRPLLPARRASEQASFDSQT